MAHAAYVAELVSKLCAPRQVEPEVYDWLLAFLGALDRHGATAERLRVFELGLLGRLGFGPMVETCAVCGGAQSGVQVSSAAGDEEVSYRWDPDRGGAVCGACGRRGRPIRSVVRRALARLAASPVDAPVFEPLPPDVNRGGRDAIFEIIKLHINGPLLSLDFIAKMGGHV
jgi:DNA repair protein RecO